MQGIFIGFKAAAEYCGMHKETLAYHRRQGHLQPDDIQAGAAIFTKATLDTFLAKYRSDEGMSKKDIQAEFGIPASVVQYHMDKKGLTPERKNGNTWMFDRETVMRHFGLRENGEDSDT